MSAALARPSGGSVRSFVDAGEGEGEHRLTLLVEGAHCAACIQTIEGRLGREPGVTAARLNLGLRRLSLAWRGGVEEGDRLAGLVEAAGYHVVPFDPAHLEDQTRGGWHDLLGALAVAGFAASNSMMLALPVWVGEDMDAATRLFLQGIAGLVVVPAVLWSGRVFFASALRALAAGRTNIDVPISLGLLLTLMISVAELLRGGPEVYFDSAAAFLFVLLLGRVLEFRVRARARATVERLLMLRVRGATRLCADGSLEQLRAADIAPGMVLVVRAGEQVPVDGTILSGRSSLDRAIVTGESVPVAVGPGDAVLAGTVNGEGALTLRADRPMATSHLAELVRLVEAAELRRGRLVALADRVAGLWTPVIHGLALATFAGWALAGGEGMGVALLHAVCVLIIACPCALGLAVPAVQVVAVGALMRRGVLLRSGDALERLAAVDLVVFDKTGTLTLGMPVLRRGEGAEDPTALALAAGLAAASLHPLARALVAAAPGATALPGVVERPGHGLVWQGEAGEVRLGSALFCGVAADPPPSGGRPAQDPTAAAAMEVWLARPGAAPVRFRFTDALRPDAARTVAALRRRGLAVALLSGDAPAAVAAVAAELGIADAAGGLAPADKLARLEAWRAQGRRVLMVGDGLNDAPALAGAHVSASFTHGAPVSQCAADIVLPAEGLMALDGVLAMGARATGLVRQNLALAALYNVGLIPLAMAGQVTPVAAALAMSTSSLTVILNALRAGAPHEGPVMRHPS